MPGLRIASHYTMIHIPSRRLEERRVTVPIAQPGIPWPRVQVALDIPHLAEEVYRRTERRPALGLRICHAWRA
jgi:hypothetical protein